MNAKSGRLTGGEALDRTPSGPGDDLVGRAVGEGASAIHFDWNAGTARMRVDGALRQPFAIEPELAGRLAAELGGALVRTIAIDDRRVELRLSSLPTSPGTHAVLHLRSEGRARDGLGGLGMLPRTADIYARALEARRGLILLAGAARSDSAPMLVAGLEALGDGRRCVLAVDAPRGRPTPGVFHFDALPGGANTQAEILREALDQDCDVLIVGEIAGADSAALLVEAAQDRLVLAGVRAGSAVGAIEWLRRQKVSAFHFACALKAVVAQRLVRRLCPSCREAVQDDRALTAPLGLDSRAIVYRAKGCDRCSGTGHDGSAGVYEAIDGDDGIRLLIDRGGDQALIANQAFRQAPNFASAARVLALEGVTTPEEAVRVSRTPIDELVHRQ